MKNPKVKLFARHGDVYIYKIEEGSIETKNPEKKDKQILALGEVSGHMHVIKGDMIVDEKAVNDGIYFEMLTQGSLSHDEHETITFEPGKYISIIQVEYDPVTRFRKVRD